MTRTQRNVKTALKGAHPKTAVHLAAADANRRSRLSRLIGGARLSGYEELIDHLEELEPVFARNKRLRPIAFLIGRARGDFHTALEAGLSGFHSVAYDAMRDVMEIEFLLRDFLHEPQHIAEWVSCNERQRLRKFRPAILRQRHASRLGMRPEDLRDATDYRGHSRVLHVSPHRNPLGAPGIIEAATPWAEDTCFWEIFEHGRRLLFAAHRLRRKLARHLKSPWGPERGLRVFREAWQRTQEMQTIWRSMVEASQPQLHDDAA